MPRNVVDKENSKNLMEKVGAQLKNQEENTLIEARTMRVILLYLLIR